jgi:hypothetical protein
MTHPQALRVFSIPKEFQHMQVADFRAVEEHAGGGGAAIAEMPVHVADLFGGRDEP